MTHVRFVQHGRTRKPHAVVLTPRGIWASLCGRTWKHETEYPDDPEWVAVPGRRQLCSACRKRLDRLYVDALLEEVARAR